MDPEHFNPNSRLRASDADRDRAASVLNDALAEGRLTPEEHSQRLDSIYAARTQADLVPLIEDLPARAEFAVPALRPGGRRPEAGPGLLSQSSEGRPGRATGGYRRPPR